MSLSLAPAIADEHWQRHVVDGGWNVPEVNMNGANGARIMRALGLFDPTSSEGVVPAADLRERAERALDELGDEFDWQYLEMRLRELRDLADWAQRWDYPVHWY
jgi:hypothetical protein